jgi:hypothetical protein
MLFQRPSAKPSSLLIPFYCSLVLFLLATGVASAQTAPATQTSPASSSSDVQQAQVAQKPKDVDNRDVAVLGFGQDTSQTNGNSIRNGTTASGGGMLSFRQSPRWWAGYEVSYGYTKYTDTYYYATYRVDHNSNELTLAYLMKSPAYSGFHVFGTLGAGVIALQPSESGGTVTYFPGSPASQTLPVFVYTIGVERRVTARLGVRIQYRSDVYKDPDFKEPALDTMHLRSTAEPGIGVYYHF